MLPASSEYILLRGVLTKITNRIGGTERKIGTEKWVEKNFYFGGVRVFCVCSVCVLPREKETLSYQRKILHAKPPLTNKIYPEPPPYQPHEITR